MESSRYSLTGFEEDTALELESRDKREPEIRINETKKIISKLKASHPETGMSFLSSKVGQM